MLADAGHARTIAVALALFLATGMYYLLRSRDVRIADPASSWTWAALIAGICLGGIVAEGLDDAIAFSYVIGGILSAVPLLICAQRMTRSS